MKILRSIILFSIFAGSMLYAGQNILIEREKNELLKLNNEILKKIKNKEDYHNKKIIVQVKQTKKEGNTFYIIDDISSDADTEPIIDKSDFLIEGSLKKEEDNNYYFDIEHIIPPDENFN